MAHVSGRRRTTWVQSMKVQDPISRGVLRGGDFLGPERPYRLGAGGVTLRATPECGARLKAMEPREMEPLTFEF